MSDCDVDRMANQEDYREAVMYEYYVDIMRFENDGELVERMGPFTEKKAEKVDGGVNINLNHEEYYTLIVEEEV